MPAPIELHVVRDWDSAWGALVRPWLALDAGLRRDFVVVPTRGQAHGLKLRCVREGRPLLGVEFLTTGLARQKARALQPPGPAPLGRELLLLNFRTLVAERLAPVATTDPEWGWWKSLASDAERALDDFDELLHAGFSGKDFPAPALAEVFGALERRIADLGYELGPAQQISAGLAVPAEEAPRLPGRLLIHGFTAEHWPDFFMLAALARRASGVMVLAPEPGWRGGSAIDEGWIEAWSSLLGVEPRPAPADAPEPQGAAVARVWSGEDGDAHAAQVLVGHTRGDEMELVIAEIAARLAAGARNIGVVLAGPGPSHARLVRLLGERGIPFNDLLATVAPAGIDALLQRDLLDFHAKGARIEGLLRLWPRLQALNLTTASPGEARDVLERAFDRRQTHLLADVQADLSARGRSDWSEVARVTQMLLPPWPGRLAIGDAAARFERLCAALGLPLPDTWSGLADYARRDLREHALEAVVAALLSFVPEQAPVADAPGRGQFAPVTLTTRRRAAALGWSDLLLVEANAGVWPTHREASVWLTDEQRRILNARSRFSVSLFTGEDRARFEREGYADLARNTTGRVILTAAETDPREPELALAPNGWLERVLLGQEAQAVGADAFAFRSRRVRTEAAVPRDPTELERWRGLWLRRRDPAAPFDEFFLSGNAEALRPAQLAARLIERGVADPAELWFGAILDVKRSGWAPLVRARRKALGSLAHSLLAQALRGPPAEGGFRQRLPEAAARLRLNAAVAAWRAERPADRYWESFAGELAEVASVLLGQAYAVGGGAFVGVEMPLPPSAALRLPGGRSLGLVGRMDLVWSDRPQWEGAEVDVVDFKTGADARLTVAGMARGASLQLGLYLAATQALGAKSGRVWMVKPDGSAPGGLSFADLGPALGPALRRLGRHFSTGCYGALTPDRSAYAHGFEWPLACVPIRRAILEKKFAATFPETPGAGEDDLS